MSFDKYMSFAFSSIGSAHIKAGRVCQDASRSFGNYNFSAAVVCDGHGGDKHFRSDVGSKIAVDVCEQSVREIARYCSHIGKLSEATALWRNLEAHIISAWRSAAYDHYCKNPFSQSELDALKQADRDKVTFEPLIAYGSTCLLALVCGKFLYLMQLGDGDIRLIRERKCFAPLQADDRLAFGTTTSLCDENALANVRDYVAPIKKIKGCWLSTDGVINSFCDEKSFCNFIYTARREYAKLSFKEFQDEVAEFLPRLSEIGSGDDVSIGCIFKKTQRK